MKLKELLKELPYQCQKNIEEADITDIIYDSRKVQKGCLFVCLVGAKLDAHIYAKEALEKGAKAILAEQKIEEELYKNHIIIEVENTRKALAILSAAYFQYPAKQMTTIAITGTKGKTTTAYMTKAILEKAGKKVGIIGTIGAFYKDIKIETKNTTPESYELQKILRQMADENITHVVMEVSSQAFKTFRVEGMEFDYGLFTNISPDHIGEGEHKDFEEYLFYKSQLFQHCRIGILNQDDEKWKEVLKNHTCEEKTFGLMSKEIEGTTILKQIDKEVQLAVNEFGEGRTVYISGLPYSFENSRLLYRAILWSAHDENELHKWYSTNFNVEVHAYVKNGKYCVVNNTYEPQSTTVYKGDGTKFDVDLEANGILWYEI